MGTESKPTAPRSTIKWVALWVTPWVWLVGTATIVLHNGQPFYRGAVLGGVAALGGLVAWLIYHTVSGRPDGLACFLMALAVTTSSDRDNLPLRTELTWAVSMVVWNSLIAAGLGWYYRERPKGAGQANGSPLWDAQIDPPSS